MEYLTYCRRVYQFFFGLAAISAASAGFFIYTATRFVGFSERIISRGPFSTTIIACGSIAIVSLLLGFVFKSKVMDLNFAAKGSKFFQMGIAIMLLASGAGHLGLLVWAFYRAGFPTPDPSVGINIGIAAVQLLGGWMMLKSKKGGHIVAAISAFVQIPIVTAAGINYMLLSGPSIIVWVTRFSFSAKLYLFEGQFATGQFYGPSHIGINLLSLLIFVILIMVPKNGIEGDSGSGFSSPIKGGDRTVTARLDLDLAQ